MLVNTSITTNNVKPFRQNTSTNIKSLVITPREIVKSKIKSEFAISNKSKQQRVKTFDDVRNNERVHIY